MIPRIVELIHNYEDRSIRLRDRYEAIDQVVQIVQHICVVLNTHTPVGNDLHQGFLNVLAKATKAAVDLRTTQYFDDELDFLNSIRNDLRN